MRTKGWLEMACQVSSTVPKRLYRPLGMVHGRVCSPEDRQTDTEEAGPCARRRSAERRDEAAPELTGRGLPLRWEVGVCLTPWLAASFTPRF